MTELKDRPLSGKSETSLINVDSALASGDVSSAVELCIETGNWIDALMLVATAGSPELSARVHKQYFEVCGPSSSSEMVRAIATGDWKGLVEKCDLQDWESVLTAVLTYVMDEGELELVVDMLGERLRNSGEISDVKKAVVCYVCNNKSNKVVECAARMKYFDVAAFACEVSKAVEILKKSAEARICNGIDVRSGMNASRVTRPAMMGPPDGFFCSQPDISYVPGNGAPPMAINSIPHWNGFTQSIVVPGHPVQAVQLRPPPRLANGCPPNHFSKRGCPVPNATHQFPPTTTSRGAVVRNIPPQQFVNFFPYPPRFLPRSGGTQSAPFNNRASNGYVGPPVFQYPSSPRQSIAPVEFQPSSRPQSPIRGGFLSRLKSPIVHPTGKYNIFPNNLSPAEHDSSDSELPSPVSPGPSQLSASENSLYTPEKSFDTELIQDSKQENSSDRHKDLSHFLENVKNIYCDPDDAKCRIQKDVVENLASRVQYWQRKFE